jgi:signal transduction histidine kinase
VDRITRAAEQIGAEDLSRRLDLGPPNDELGRLAGAFDGMIGRLEAAFRRQQQFTADASHELRTPLSVIRSQVDVALGRQREPGYYVRTLESVRQETVRMERLTENLLTLARADSDAQIALSAVDLEALVSEVAVRVTLRARERGLSFDVRIEPAVAVLGSEQLLTQLLTNLLDNAMRHTARGGQISVSLESSGDGVLIKVADTGTGIAPEHVPRLTERFYRADQSRSRVSGGTGLGLAICAWVAQIHRGRMEIESELNVGTIVTVWLPVSTARPAPLESERISLPELIPVSEGSV